MPKTAADKAGVPLAGADAVPASDRLTPTPPDVPSAPRNAVFPSGDATLSSRNGALHERNATLHERNAPLHERNATLRERNVPLHERNVTLHERNAPLHERNATLRERNATLRERNATLRGRNAPLRERNAALSSRNEALKWAKMAFLSLKASKTPVFAVFKGAAVQKATVSGESTSACSSNPDWFHARPHPGPLLQGEGAALAWRGKSDDRFANPVAVNPLKAVIRFPLSASRVGGEGRGEVVLVLPLTLSSPRSAGRGVATEGLRGAGELVWFAPMKFALAIAVFGLFAFFISWGIIELLKGRPWLLIAALGVFLGTFVKYGCRSH